MNKNNSIIIIKSTKLYPFPTNVYDISNSELCKSIAHNYGYELYKKKRVYSRSKTKLIRDGSYIPLENMNIDEFGYTEYTKLIRKNIFNTNKLIISSGLSFEFNNDINNCVFPLHIQTNKYRKPCGSNIHMLKNYLQYVKNISLEMRKNIVKVSWMKCDDIIEKIVCINLNKFKQVTMKHNYLKNYKNNIISPIKGLICRMLYENNLFPIHTRNISMVMFNQKKIKHLLLPFIEVKCPCEFMGCKKCNKYINILQLLCNYNTLSIYNNRKNGVLYQFNKWLCDTFIKDILFDNIREKNNVVNVKLEGFVFRKQSYKFPENEKKIKKITHITINRCVCHNCGEESIIQNYKKSKSQIKKSGTHNMISCKKCCSLICGCCGNAGISHTKTIKKGKKRITVFLQKCPPIPNFEVISNETICDISRVLNEENVETSKCPKCDLLVTKDDACDKVMCGKIDGSSITGGCGTKFCFRCSEDITHLGYDYLDHLIVTMKPDGSNTNWICRKFAKPCPTCDIKQYWDGVSDKIHCGNCNAEFGVE